MSSEREATLNGKIGDYHVVDVGGEYENANQFYTTIDNEFEKIREEGQLNVAFDLTDTKIPYAACLDIMMLYYSHKKIDNLAVVGDSDMLQVLENLAFTVLPHFSAYKSRENLEIHKVLFNQDPPETKHTEYS